MPNSKINAVFKRLFGENPDFCDFDDRLKMQKAVYLLEVMGLSVGDYCFRWYIHGPYSQTLQNDILYSIDNSDQQLKLGNLTKENERIFTKLRDIINQCPNDYDTTKWIECLASIHYLRDFLLPLNFSKDKVLNKLLEYKPHLNKNEANEAAYSVISPYFSFAMN